MGKNTMSDSGLGPSPTPSTPEAATFEYFHNRISFGVWATEAADREVAPGSQRERFEAELAWLEGARARHEAITEAEQR